MDEKEKFRERIEQFEEIMRNHPNDYREQLEKIGYTWHLDDEGPDLEAEEEAQAKPENNNQMLLVECFEGKIEVNTQVLGAYKNETKIKEDVNFPLFRKYFKQGNEALKKIILLSLEQEPTHPDFLSDLVYFHEHHLMLSTVVKAYRRACDLEENLGKLKTLITNFYYHTKPDGYDVASGLKEQFQAQPEKLKLLTEVLKEIVEQENSNEVVSF